jgi:hypothetical protein
LDAMSVLMSRGVCLPSPERRIDLIGTAAAPQAPTQRKRTRSGKSPQVPGGVGRLTAARRTVANRFVGLPWRVGVPRDCTSTCRPTCLGLPLRQRALLRRAERAGPHARMALLIFPHAADLTDALTTYAGARARHAHHRAERGHAHVVRSERANVSTGAGIGAGNVAELTRLGIGAGVGAAYRDKATSNATVRVTRMNFIISSASWWMIVRRRCPLLRRRVSWRSAPNRRRRNRGQKAYTGRTAMSMPGQPVGRTDPFSSRTRNGCADSVFATPVEKAACTYVRQRTDVPRLWGI